MTSYQSGRKRSGRQAGAGDLPFKLGAIFGGVAYFVGYVLTYVLFRLDDGLSSGAEFADAGGSTRDAVGWVFYNLHHIDTELTMTSGGETESETTSIISERSTDIPELVYYLVPIIGLLVVGYMLAQRVQLYETGDALKIGSLGVAGYLPLTILGTLLFDVSGEEEGFGETISYSVSPELLPAVLIMGVIFPLLFGAIGGYIQFWRTQNSSRR